MIQLASLIQVNLIAVLVASAISMGIGMYWFSKKGFGKQWIKLSGFSQKEFKEAHEKKNMGVIMFFASIALLATNLILANILKLTGTADLLSGAQLGLLLWFGLVAPVQLGMVLWEGKPFKLYLIITLHELVSLVIAGALLAVWA